MSVYGNTPQYQPGVAAGAVSRAALHFANAILALRDAVADWNTARVTRRELSKLSDQTLDDIGLCRGDIAVAARKR